MRTLNALLPPPRDREQQIRDSLRNVLNHAVRLAIDFRTQRAEYFMWEAPSNPSEQTIPFASIRMNNRGNEGLSNSDLEREEAIVKLVLFPLVTKRGDENGENYDVETVITPMQVLVTRATGDTSSRGSRRTRHGSQNTLGDVEMT